MIPLDRVRELLSLAPGPHGGTLLDTSFVHDLARDVLTLADALATAERERDEARAERDKAKDTAHCAVVEWHAISRERDTARSALDALLRGAPCGYVPAGVVREYLTAVDASRRIAGETDDILSEAAVDDWRTRHGAASKAKVAARTALDAALLAATTTPTEGHRP